MTKIIRKYFPSSHSFWRGVGKVLDIGYTLPTTIYYDELIASTFQDEPKNIDCEALQSDWEMVGNDLYVAIKKLEEERADHCE